MVTDNANLSGSGVIEVVENTKEAIPGIKTRDDRQRIADLIVTMIDGGMAEHGSQSKRCERNQKYYNNNPDNKGLGELPFENASDHHAPLVQPIIDLIVETIAQPIIEADPYWNVSSHGQGAEFAYFVEQDLAYFARNAGFETMVYESLTMAAINGIAMVRVPFEVMMDGFNASNPKVDITLPRLPDAANQIAQISFCGPNLEVWHPMETHVYPLAAKKLERARESGHFLEWRIQEVQEWQRQGKFFADSIVQAYNAGTTDAGRDSDSDLTTEDLAPTSVDQMCRLDVGLVKLDLDGDGFEEVYQYVIAYAQSALLDLEPYVDMRTNHYVPIQLHTEHNAFYPSFSIADHLQRSQSYFNELHNLFLDGAQMAATPPAFVQRGMQDSQVEKTAPGQVVYTDDVPEIEVLPVTFNGAPVISALQMIKTGAYESAGISANDQGQSLGPETTATEAVRVASFSNRRTTGYREKASKGFERIGYLFLDHYRANYELLKAVHGDRLLCPAKEVLDFNYHLKVAGATMANTPVQQAGAIQSILQALPQIMELDPHAMGAINVPALLRSLVQTSQLPNQDSIMREGEDADHAGMLVQIRMILEQLLESGALEEIAKQQKAPAKTDAKGKAVPKEIDCEPLMQAIQQIGGIIASQGQQPGA